MATVYRKPNSPYWYAQFYDHRGKRVSRSTGKEKRREAEKVAEDLESDERKAAKDKDHSRPLHDILATAARDASSGSLSLERASELLERMKRVANPDFKEVTVRELWKQWREDQDSRIADNTKLAYSFDEKIVIDALGKRGADLPISKISHQMITAAIKKASAEEGRKGSTVNKAFGLFRRALAWACSRKLIESNPASEIRPVSQKDSFERGPFTEEEVRSLLSHATPEWFGIILIGAYTGLRLGDVVSLTESHIDNGRIVIRPAKTARTKKTIAVPLAPSVLEWLGDKTGSFFPLTSKLSAARQSMMFTRLMRKSGVPKEVIAPGGIKLRRSFHSLRHTFSSWLAEADVKPEVRQRLTGHSSSRIHQKYTHLDEILKDAVKKLPGLT